MILGWRGGCSLGLSRVGSYPLNANLIGLMALPKICPTLSSAKTPTLDPSPVSHFSPVLQLLFSLIRERFRRHYTEEAEQSARPRIILDLLPLARLNLSIALRTTPPSAGACTTKYLHLPPQYQHRPTSDYILCEFKHPRTNGHIELGRV